jgi:5-formyltetrahydrofolate cyclo-ligase
MLKEQKSELRKALIAARDAMSAESHDRASQLIVKKIAADPACRAANKVMAYRSFGSELDTLPFLEATLAAGKMLVLPRVDQASKSLKLYRVTDLTADLHVGKWGILEPRADEERRVELDSVDFVLVPGVGFDAQCHRLGYGAGFYDRLFGEAQRAGIKLPRRVAGAFDSQIVASVPVSETDLPVDGVMTETREYQRTNEEN